MKLGEEVAMKVFSEWYKGEKFYNYEGESATTYTMYTGKFIVQVRDVYNNIFGVINKMSYKIWE